MKKKTEKSCLWKQSPLLAPHRKWRFARLHAVCQTKMGYVKQDTWHVWKPIFWYMHLYHALLSKRTCGYYLCFFFWFPLFLKFFIIHPPPVTRGGGGEERKETSPSSHFHVLDLVSFLVRPKPRIPFFGLFLLRNQTETLAAQASF